MNREASNYFVGGKQALYAQKTQIDVQSSPKPYKMFMDIPTAAGLAGFSVKHFRRIIEDDQIPIVQINRKFFILGRDFATWEADKKSRKD